VCSAAPGGLCASVSSDLCAVTVPGGLQASAVPTGLRASACGVVWRVNLRRAQGATAGGLSFCEAHLTYRAAVKKKTHTSATSTAKPDPLAKFKAAQAKAAKVGVENLTKEDIEGLTSAQITELRGY
jgi:hypothetical protein